MAEGKSGKLGAFLARWPAGVVRYRWPIAIVWVVVVVVLAPGARNVENRLEVAARMPSGQAERVRLDLERRFRSPLTDRVLLVCEGLPGPDTAEGKEALETIVDALRAIPGVSGTLSSLDTEDSLFAGREGGFLIVVGLEAGSQPVETLLPRLRAASASLTARLHPTLSGRLARLDGRGAPELRPAPCERRGSPIRRDARAAPDAAAAPSRVRQRRGLGAAARRRGPVDRAVARDRGVSVAVSSPSRS